MLKTSPKLSHGEEEAVISCSLYSNLHRYSDKQYCSDELIGQDSGQIHGSSSLRHGRNLPSSSRPYCTASVPRSRSQLPANVAQKSAPSVFTYRTRATALHTRSAIISHKEAESKRRKGKRKKAADSGPSICSLRLGQDVSCQKQKKIRVPILERRVRQCRGPLTHTERGEGGLDPQREPVVGTGGAVREPAFARPSTGTVWLLHGGRGINGETEPRVVAARNAHAPNPSSASASSAGTKDENGHVVRRRGQRPIINRLPHFHNSVIPLFLNDTHDKQRRDVSTQSIQDICGCLNYDHIKLITCVYLK
ncbi:hypothetical protein SRHO_G00085920 [Serrasalmus rhombeus]